MLKFKILLDKVILQPGFCEYDHFFLHEEQNYKLFKPTEFNSKKILGGISLKFKTSTYKHIHTKMTHFLFLCGVPHPCR